RSIPGTACFTTTTASPDGDEEDKTMISLTLHPMKEIKIVVQGEHLKFATDLLDRVGATGYTIINNVSGKGHHGFHEGHLLFNDTSSQVMVFTVVPEEKVEPILAGLGPLFNKHSGTMFVTDTAVSRREHFIAK
ncbi:MAG TPA: P-II family nitrogen regulator, partial [Nitrospiraceae bacterium]|nr:P-II family nitrogen regulator [Nitrospiraceae bacterium]